jgi:hypothetical protein
MEDVLVTSLLFVCAKLFVQIKLGLGVPAILTVAFCCCPHTFRNDVRIVFSYRPQQPSLEHQFYINERTNSCGNKMQNAN